jgi:hypothetical protein
LSLKKNCFDASALMRAEVCDLAAFYYATGKEALRTEGWHHPIDAESLEQARAWFEARYPHTRHLLKPDSAQTVAALMEQPEALSGGFLQQEGLCAGLDWVGYASGGWFLESFDFAGSPRSSHKERFTLQLFLLQRVCGIDVKRITLYLPDRQFVRTGEPVDWARFFRPHNLTRSVRHRLVRIEQAKERIEHPPAPVGSPPIGAVCRSPIRCDFYAHCLGHLPEHSVLSLARVDSQKRFELLRRGYLTPEQIPADEPLGRYPHIQIRSEREDEPVINAAAIAEYLLDFHYPLYFLDFETVQHVIPPFEGLHPFEPLPFAFSLHRLSHPGAAPEHFSFIVPGGMDGRRKMAAQLVALIGPSGRLVAYGADYERRMLRRLAAWNPALKKELESMAKRTLDLMIPFEKRWCYHPKMRGSCSLKRVAPALDSQLDYGALVVGDGRDAMEAYLALEGASDARQEEILAALERYGALDSLAMVHIFEQLEKLAMAALVE